MRMRGSEGAVSRLMSAENENEREREEKILTAQRFGECGHEGGGGVVVVAVEMADDLIHDGGIETTEGGIGVGVDGGWFRRGVYGRVEHWTGMDG